MDLIIMGHKATCSLTMDHIFHGQLMQEVLAIDPGSRSGPLRVYFPAP